MRTLTIYKTEFIDNEDGNIFTCKCFDGENLIKESFSFPITFSDSEISIAIENSLIDKGYGLFDEIIIL